MQHLTRNGYLNPIWMLRLMTGAVALLLVAAFLLISFSKTPHFNAANVCVGAALGLVIGLCAFCFSSVKDITLNNQTQPSDVEPYKLQ